MDIDNLCKCVAHAVLKHIEFAEGEILVDDLVQNEDEIPQFSYNLGCLDIDLEEIDRQKQLREWEAEAYNMENYDRLQYLMQGGDPYMYQGEYDVDYNGGFMSHEDVPEECDRIPTDQIYVRERDNGEMPKVTNVNNTINISTDQPLSANADIHIDHRSNSQAYNVPVIRMDEMLNPDFNPTPSRGAMNSYYANLSVMGLTKPFFFPPPDLGMVESMGSYENSSRFFRSVKSNMNRSFGKNTSVIGV